ncbi:MAG: PilZ domain-containing protein [Desulfomonile tiedjei]|nr:PilZ domain-containing protein [Desulfomonile tiedjei]
MKRQIKGRDLIKDVRAGMADWELQVKYRLSPKDLRAAFNNLVAREAITHDELYQISPFYKDAADGFKERRHCRADLPVYVPVHDVDTAAIGVLRDVSETGFRVAGLEATIGQVKTFLLPVETFISADPLVITAECKWIETKGRHKVYTVAGFEIIDIPDKVQAILREFTELISLGCKTGEWQEFD